MGTRGLTCVVQDNEYKVAQYGQWDHYLDGAGLSILHALRNIVPNLDAFKQTIRTRVERYTDQELSNVWNAYIAPLVTSGWVPMEVEEKVKNDYPTFSRDMGYGIIAHISNGANANIIPVHPRLSFAADSLFCEYCYVIDLDKDTFEVYKGFNKTPLSSDERFYFLQNEDKEYYPVRHAATFSLDDLPSDDEFMKKFDEGDE